MEVKEKPTEQYYVGSVLLSDHIKSFVDKGLLIADDTFDERQLRRAKYDVRLGKVYYKAGEYRNLDDSNPLLVVEPFGLVFVESYEIFKLPENVVAKYDLRIRGCLEGMGLQTGLHLDPTYYGRFFCPLFNFSDSAFPLRYKDHLASVEFSYTTPPTTETKPYTGKQELFSLSQALPDMPRHSGLEELWTSTKKTEETLEGELVKFRDTATRLHTRVDTMVGAVFVAMTFTIAALGVVVAAVSTALTSGLEFEPLPVTISILVLFGIALVGILIGGYALIRKMWRKIFRHRENVTRH